MRQLLTSTYLESIKPPPAGRIEVADLRCAGLAYRVTAAGARSWCWRFRDPVTGRTSRATLGKYPAVSLASARTKAEALRRQVERGTNPVAAKRKEREEADSKTFAALAQRYLAEHARRHKKPKSIEEDERNLRLHVLPAWGSRPFAAIARRDMIALAEELVTGGKPVLANRVQALVSSIFSFAIDADLIDVNPVSRLRKRGVENCKTRVLTDEEIRLLWGCAVLPPVSRPVGLVLRLCLLTGLRGGEATGLCMAEVENLDDPERAALTIKGERTKNGRVHHVPLAPLAVETVRELMSLTAGAPACEANALGVAMRRMSDKLPDKPGAETWRADPPTPHDLRRTAATRLAGLGVPGEDVSAILNHVRQDVTGKHYDQYSRAREKRSALATWAAALGRILDPKSAEVVPLRNGRAR